MVPVGDRWGSKSVESLCAKGCMTVITYGVDSRDKNHKEIGLSQTQTTLCPRFFEIQHAQNPGETYKLDLDRSSLAVRVNRLLKSHRDHVDADIDHPAPGEEKEGRIVYSKYLYMTQLRPRSLGILHGVGISPLAVQ